MGDIALPTTRTELAARIDHTLLGASTTSQDVRRHCREAQDHGFACVCVNPRWVPLARELLHGSAVRVGSVVGFLFGAEVTAIKTAQARQLVMAGVDEVDMMADLAAILEGDERCLRRELKAVLEVCRSMRPAVTLKVIIESAALTQDQIVFACRVAQGVGVDFLKTSTGLHPAGGATVEAVTLMAEAAPRCRIKAAGGIRTGEDAMSMLRAGACRIGSSASVQIVESFADSAGSP